MLEEDESCIERLNVAIYLDVVGGKKAADGIEVTFGKGGPQMLLLSDNSQVSPGVLTALSVNQLLTHVPMGSPGQTFLDSLTIPGFLSWALLIIGVHTWSQRSWAFSAILVLIPIVCLYGIWAFFAFR